jgi:hypothetical protein
VRTLVASHVCQLAASYSPTARQAPTSLFLKWSRPSLEPRFGAKEVEFYTSAAAEATGLPLIRCFDAVFSDETGRSHILLEDVSATHAQPPAPLPPSIRDCGLAIDSIARLHAHFWEHQRLGDGIGRLTTETEFAELVGMIETKLTGFLDFMGDRLGRRRRDFYGRVLAGSMSPWRRMLRRDGLTLSHGDAHWWNFLYPRRDDDDGGADATALIFDWHLWHVDAPMKDLAYMIAMNWYPSRRAALEEELLRRYHDGLLSCGVANYSWEDCWLEYRHMIVRELFVPMWQWSSGMEPALWWSNLEKIWLAFEDLDCAELLD